MKILAKNFIQQVDLFIKKNSNPQASTTFAIPSIVDFMPFSTLRLRGRNLNRLLRIPLKIMHRATSKYYIAQQEENMRLQERVENLELRIRDLESERNEQ